MDAAEEAEAMMATTQQEIKPTQMYSQAVTQQKGTEANVQKSIRVKKRYYASIPLDEVNSKKRTKVRAQLDLIEKAYDELEKKKTELKRELNIYNHVIAYIPGFEKNLEFEKSEFGL